MPSLRQLQSLVVVVREGSFTKAAEALHLTQPAISWQIKALENEVGAQLMQRLEREVRLTPAGETFYARATQMLSLYQQALKGVAEIEGLERGQVRVGGGTIPGEYLLPEVLGSFKKKYPGVSVHLQIAPSGKIVEQLLREELDVGVIGAPFKADGLRLEPWVTDELVLVAPRGDPLGKRTDVAWEEDLQTRNFVMREPDSGTRMVVERALADKGWRVRPEQIVLELGSSQALISAVAAQLGLGWVSRLAAQDSMASGRVAEVKVADCSIWRHLFVASYTRHYRGRLLEVFNEFLVSWPHTAKSHPHT